MFSVPGWSINVPLKTQVLHAPARGQRKEPEPQEAGKKSLKRKRDGQQKGTQVTADNVDKLWQVHIEGKPLPKKKRRRTKSKATSKNDEAPERPDGPSSDHVAADRPDQSSKPKKQPPKADRPEQPTKSKKAQKQSKPQPPAPSTALAPAAPPRAPALPPPPAANLTPLQAKMHAKLATARFRHLNETLYTTPSASAARLFAATPQLYADYHAGFRAAVAAWPSTPAGAFASALRARGGGGRRAAAAAAAAKGAAAGRRAGRRAGGGEERRGPAAAAAARAGRGLRGGGPRRRRRHRRPHALAAGPGAARLRVRVRSFDLCAAELPVPSPEGAAAPGEAATVRVERADMAALPLPDASVDVAVAALALMGTNWPAFVAEARRVLRPRTGELWVAEVKSRFPRRAPVSALHSGAVASAAARGGNAGAGSGPAAGGRGARRGGAAAAAEGEGGDDDDDDGREDEEAWAGPDEAGGPAAARDTTDVRPFVAALRRRGFALARDGGVDGRGLPRSPAVDLRERMFVTMRFVRADGDAGAGERRRGRRKTFLEEAEEDVPVEEEARILKPCVYKLR